MKGTEYIVKSYEFKVADKDWEFEQIHKLNYDTFVNEIPQHERNEDGILIDKFNEENTYFICLDNKQVIGMIAIKAQRPFSLDYKLDNLDSYLPDAKQICEIRLLSVKREHRSSKVFYGLAVVLAEYCKDNGFDLAIISGTLSQQRLYKHIGFIPFGPQVGSEGALYQPMYLTWASVSKLVRPDSGITLSTVSVLPGPVELKPVVKKAFSECPISHRSDEFHKHFTRTKEELCKIVKAKKLEIVMGSGTLANDIVAGQISLIEGKGIILSNGEFGDRLIDHANRIHLDYIPYRKQWGGEYSIEEIEKIINENSIAWLWMVHCETSTGMLNDLPGISNLCEKHKVLLNVDTISSVATTEVDLSKVHLATCVSGKGLESLAGLALIFYNDMVIKSNKSLPRYLDLNYYITTEGVPFTISSNLVMALSASLRNLNIESRLSHIKDLSSWLRKSLVKIGYRILVEESKSIPSVITIDVPRQFSAVKVGDFVKANGFLLSYQSSYLIERNWIQICLMGNLSKPMLDNLLGVMEKAWEEHMQGFTAV